MEFSVKFLDIIILNSRSSKKAFTNTHLKKSDQIGEIILKGKKLFSAEIELSNANKTPKIIIKEAPQSSALKEFFLKLKKLK